MARTIVAASAQQNWVLFRVPRQRALRTSVVCRRGGGHQGGTGSPQKAVSVATARTGSSQQAVCLPLQPILHYLPSLAHAGAGGLPAGWLPAAAGWLPAGAPTIRARTRARASTQISAAFNQG